MLLVAAGSQSTNAAGALRLAELLELGAVVERRLAAYAVELAACTEGKPQRAGLKKPFRILEIYALTSSDCPEGAEQLG